MALPMLAGGAECGPSNPLQTLAKRFDQDRGLQQDYFGINRAGSSGVSLRSYTAGPSTSDQEVAQFFASQTTSHTVAGPPLDLSSLRETLPVTNFHTNVQHHPTADWAADFAHNTKPGQVMMTKGGFGSQALHNAPASSSNNQLLGTSSLGQVGMQWNQPMNGFRMNTAPMYLGPTNAPMQAPVRSLIDQTSWDKEFTSQEQHLSQETKIDSQIQQPSDELARTAAMLLEQVKHEENPKFKNSQFMDLMRHLRDGKVVIEGNQMVETDEGTVLRSDTKGKGRAVDDLGLGQSNFAHLTTSQATLPHNISLVMGGRQEAGSREEDANDAYFRQDNEDYIRYWAEKDVPLANPVSASETEWDKLQADWDHFEATATGIQEVQSYPFQTNNPYILGDSSRFQTTQHGHRSMIESILELEAAVQRDMNNSMAWYHLGIKQQENEREHKALQALKRAVELDPSHLPSWLALAVSYTNDSNRTGAYDSILEWMNRNEKYEDALLPLRSQMSNDSGASLATRYEGLISSLIALARGNKDDQIDADIQIALGVLLNSNEEYDKAEDCFRTALALRPDDWLLYNRIGATLANNGHAEEALQYYYRALELNPGYIRARYNLGISCINLGRCEEAAQHILDALVLQENDGTAGQNRGVTSFALWDSLKTACQHMRRADLAVLCDRRDLDAIRSTFH